jgi:DNA integrity scanning protein DisA with diadenylate cyclase activity
MRQPKDRRLQRLAEELEESGLHASGTRSWPAALFEEVDRALRPVVHERRVPSTGTILDPQADPDGWAPGTQLEIWRAPVAQETLAASRRFVDGLSSWLLRRTDSRGAEWVLFDRPAGSERDLVVVADVLDATIVQRHPSGVVRIVGAFGVLRWEGLAWHHEPPVAALVETVTTAEFTGDPQVVEAMLRFAVHDLGSMGTGALLIYRPVDDPPTSLEERLPSPLPLRMRTATHLAPLRHALAQVDGAAVFDAEGVLRHLGALLVPSANAQDGIRGFGGTRHTSGLRYSRDDPSATVIAISDDGPVSVLRNGMVLASTAAP